MSAPKARTVPKLNPGAEASSGDTISKLTSVSMNKPPNEYSIPKRTHVSPMSKA